MGKRKNHPDEVDDNQRRQNQQQQEGQQHPCTGPKNSHEEEGLHQEEESPQGEPAESWCSCASWWTTIVMQTNADTNHGTGTPSGDGDGDGGGGDDENDDGDSEGQQRQQQQRHPQGFVHPNLRYDSIRRQLSVAGTAVATAGTGTDTETTTGGTIIPANEILLRIPFPCFISEERILKLVPQLQSIIDTITHTTDTGRTLYSDIADITIALGLAIIVTMETNWNSNSSNSNSNRNAPSFLSLRSYLHSLPDIVSAFQTLLPRQDSTTNWETNFKGSPLLDRIRTAKIGIAKDYTILSQLWNDKNTNHSNDTWLWRFPNVDTYSAMLAVVSSRAFEVSRTQTKKEKNGGNNNDVKKSRSGMSTTPTAATATALIPILDLVDHCRGTATNNNNNNKKKKNISYRFDNEGMVIVQATTVLQPGEGLRMTYGAVGNGQLLLNYGFSIPDNLEPDHSSNDILEIQLDPNHPNTFPPPPSSNSNSPSSSAKNDIVVVNLRTGPKSYTYVSFVQILEYYIEQQRHLKKKDNNTIDSDPKSIKKARIEKDNNSYDSDDNDDMEAFLNECDNGEYGDDDEELHWDGIEGVVGDDGNSIDIYGEIEHENDIKVNNNHAGVNALLRVNQKSEELAGLKLFRNELKRRYDSYGLTGSSLKDVIVAGVDNTSTLLSNKYYASLLLYSEQRTIYFFAQAVDKLRRHLRLDKTLLKNDRKGTDIEQEQEQFDICLDTNDAELIENQTKELVVAYMMIRHGGV